MRYLRRGFTLIETIVVISIALVMLLILFQFFVSSNSIYLTERALVATAQTAGNTVSAVERGAHEALRVLALHTFAGVAHTASSTTLILELPAVDAAGGVVPDAYDHMVFYLEGATLYRLIETDPASSRAGGLKRLSELVQALTFTLDDTDFTFVKSVTVDITTQTSVKSQTLQSHVRQQIYLRNRFH